ncbi:acyl carrier protein [Kibdelosporangium banguiense]|uniref:Acyl carrier protein n=1 Tax=Kibdelosporangium banguiense TaxID=1365924 RepID=A0ABS4TX55_9PSEU|nr:acyl carrier protein [Kibdelosporangium banguiense]MBP2328535.1 acyl carrier protein [Kibdelosporangium banguiense]
MTDQLATIRAFVTKHTGGLEFTDEQDLFATGHVNSLFAVQIVMFVENTLGVPVVDDDLDIANFSSVARIHHYATSKQAPVGVSGQ